MPNYQGVWSLSTQYQAQGDGNWPENYVAPIALNLFGTIKKNIDKIIIDTTGNATDFGDVSGYTNHPAALGSATRAVFHVDYISFANSNTLEYAQFSTSGNLSDFGDLSPPSATRARTGLGNSTRGIISNGLPASGGYSNLIEYITIASTGNSTSFGNTTISNAFRGGFASPTRGVLGGGQSGYPNIIDYITIASTGNATDFGDLTQGRQTQGCSSSTRGLFICGYYYSGSGQYTNTIDYVTIASTGNATDFGDALDAYGSTMTASSEVRGVYGGGYDGGYNNNIRFVTIASTGNATDFGDLTTSMNGAGCSNCHGGLS